MDQCIPHEADHLDLTFFVIDIDHHDGVCPCLIWLLTDPTICPQDQDIDSISRLLAVKFLNDSWFGIWTCRLAVQAFHKHEDHATNNEQEKESKPLENPLDADLFPWFLRYIARRSNCFLLRLFATRLVNREIPNWFSNLTLHFFCSVYLRLKGFCFLISSLALLEQVIVF